MSCSPGSDQGARALLPTGVFAHRGFYLQGFFPTGSYCPQYVLTVFFFVAGFRSVRYDIYVGLGVKLHTCILFTIYVHYIFMNTTS